MSASASRRLLSKQHPSGKGGAAASHGGRERRRRGKTPKGTIEKENSWGLRLREARCWGHTLESQEVLDQSITAKLVNTLKDHRAADDAALRRATLRALAPAAAKGSRKALDAQLEAALDDPSEAVRRCALSCLEEVSGSTRARGGSAAGHGGVATDLLASALKEKGAAHHKDLEVRRCRAAALRTLAPPGDRGVAAAARSWLQDEDAEVRQSATKALGNIGRCDKDAVLALEGRLADPDWRVKQAAVESLERLALAASRPQRSLSRRSSVEKGARQSGSATVARPSALQASPGASPSAAPSGRALRGPQASPVASSQGYAGSRQPLRQVPPAGASPRAPRKTLVAGAPARAAKPQGAARRSSDSGDDGNTATKVLVEWLRGDGKSAGLPRVEATASLGRLARLAGGAAAAAAAEGLEDSWAEARHGASRSLAALARVDSEAVLDALTGKVGHHDFRVRHAAGRAMLASVGAVAAAEEEEHAAEGAGEAWARDAPKATTCVRAAGHLSLCVAEASGAIESADWASRRGAAPALRLLGGVELFQGSSAGSRALALGSVVPRLEHRDWSVRAKAAQAVGEIAQAAAGDVQAVDALSGALRDVDEEVRLRALAALPRSAPARSRGAVELAARAACGDPAPEVRVAALAAVGELAAEGRSRSRLAIRAAADALQDGEEEVRGAAVAALVQVGAGRRTAVDSAAELLLHAAGEVRLAAAEALGGLAVGEHLVQRALSRVAPLLQHGDAGVRAAAAAATARVSGHASWEGGLVGAAAAGVMLRLHAGALRVGAESEGGSEADGASAAPPGRGLEGTDSLAPADEGAFSDSGTDTEDEGTSKAPMWRYSPPRPMDRGTAPDFVLLAGPDACGPRRGDGARLKPGEVFGACEEFTNMDCITYLKLADGRGWVVARRPGETELCQRVREDEAVLNRGRTDPTRFYAGAQAREPSTPGASPRSWAGTRQRAPGAVAGAAPAAGCP